MKKLLILLMVTSLFMAFTACAEKKGTGKPSDQYFSKGYAVSVTREFNQIDEKDPTKAEVHMTFSIIADYISTTDFDPDAGYNIKQMTVTGVKMLTSPQMGEIGSINIMELYSRYLSDPHVEVKSDSTKYVMPFKPPHNSGVPALLLVTLENIATYDTTKSEAAKNGRQPTFSEIYEELGITGETIAFKLGFTIELLTVSGERLYKEYEVQIPSAGMDIYSGEFYYEYYETDIAKMEPFLEK